MKPNSPLLKQRREREIPYLRSHNKYKQYLRFCNMGLPQATDCRFCWVNCNVIQSELERESAFANKYCIWNRCFLRHSSTVQAVWAYAEVPSVAAPWTKVVFLFSALSFWLWVKVRNIKGYLIYKNRNRTRV